MYTVDASVWINGFFANEAGNELSKAFLGKLTLTRLPIYLPHLAYVEIVAGIARPLGAGDVARAYAQAIAAIQTIVWIPVDDRLASLAALLAADHGLRGADAIYTAVASQYRCTLVSLDHDHLTRSPPGVQALTPAAAINLLK